MMIEQTGAQNDSAAVSGRGDAVIVRDLNGRSLGILTERAILRALGARGGRAPSLRVEDLQTRIASPGPTSADPSGLLGLMRRRRIRHVPVVDRGRLVGLISLRDLNNRAPGDRAAAPSAGAQPSYTKSDCLVPVVDDCGSCSPIL